MTDNTDPFVPLNRCSDSPHETASDTESWCRKPPVTVPRPPCDACGTEQHTGRIPIQLGAAEYAVCESCCDHLASIVEAYYWYDRFTEAHYRQAADYLRSLDEIWCVHDHAYIGGELWVHTPYCDAAVVRAVMDHFGLEIYWFSIVRPSDDPAFECVQDHGPCIEICLDFRSHRKTPRPLSASVPQCPGTDWLDESDTIF